MPPDNSTVGADRHLGRRVNQLEGELREAHLQEAATAEILRVISHSKADVQPAFDAILRSAVNLCDAEIAAVFPYDGKLVHLGATHNWSKDGEPSGAAGGTHQSGWTRAPYR